MKTTIRTTSSVQSPTTNIKSNNTNALATALKLSNQFYKASGIKSKYKAVLSRLAEKLNKQVERAIIQALGGSKIQDKTGLGFQPDYYLKVDDTIELREQKLASIEEKDNTVVREKKSLRLGGNEGISITKGTKKLVQGYTLDEKGNLIENIASVSTTNLYNQLKDATSSEEIKKILNSKSKASTYLRNNIMLKAQNIDIPVVFGGILQNRSIKFTWTDIIKNKSINISAKKVGEDTLKLQIYFSASLITKALNDVNKVIIRELNGELGETITKIVAEVFTFPNTITANELADWLKDNGFEYGLSYLVGSAIISRGKAKFLKSNKKATTIGEKTVRVISDIEFSALVQKRTEQDMPHGPLRGPPLSATKLTYRTGNFVNSIKVVQNFRNQLIKYYYSPNYLTHEKTRRAPRFLLQKSIREIVQQEYGIKFRIIRGF